MITITFTDDKIDTLGRRTFTMEWNNPNGVYLRDLKDGKEIGYNRGQYFFADPKKYVEDIINRGDTVIVIDMHGKTLYSRF
jgi:hypothetical protein